MSDVFLLTTCAATAAAVIALMRARAERRRADHERAERWRILADERQQLAAIRAGERAPLYNYQTYPPENPLDGRRAVLLWRGSKKSHIAQSVRALKYRKLTRAQAAAVAAALARDLEKQYTLSGWHVDIITGAPGDLNRTRQRGFNPADELARELARRVMRPYRPLLTRIRQVKTQTEVHTGTARRQNLVGAFTARPCAGLTVLVIDDVATTGATLIECARALKAAGAVRVYALTIGGARAPSIAPTSRTPPACAAAPQYQECS